MPAVISIFRAYDKRGQNKFCRMIGLSDTSEMWVKVIKHILVFKCFLLFVYITKVPANTFDSLANMSSNLYQH